MRNFISPVQRQKLAQYARDNYPNFESFMVKWFEWMETDHSFVAVLENWKPNMQPHTAADEYLDAMLADLGWNWHGELSIPKHLLITALRDFYMSRGTRKSFEWLFRLLFNKTVRVEYPREKLLIPSAAEYTSETIMFSTANSRDSGQMKTVAESLGKGNHVFIEGMTSGVISGVEEITIINSSGKTYYQIVITETLHEFLPREDIRIVDENAFVIERNINVLDIEVEKAGTFQKTGEIIHVEGCNIPGMSVIQSLHEGAIDSVEILTAGADYKKSEVLIASTQDQTGFGFYGRISKVSADGEIQEIELLNHGHGYKELPTITVQTEKGLGAKFLVKSKTIGGINKIAQKQPHADFDIATVSITQGDAVLKPKEKATFTRYYFRSRLGVIGECSTLIDSLRYQQFSYDLISSVSADKQDGIVDKLLHPYGYIRTSVFEIASLAELDVEMIGSREIEKLAANNYLFTLDGEAVVTIPNDWILTK